MQQSPGKYLLCSTLLQVLDADTFLCTLTGHSLSVHGFSSHQCGTNKSHSQPDSVLIIILTIFSMYNYNFLCDIEYKKIGYPVPPKPTYHQRNFIFF